MDVYRIDTNPDPKKRAEPQLLSSQEMRGNWTYHAFVASHDGKSRLVFAGRGFEIHRDGKVARFAVPLVPAAAGVYWSPDNNFVTFWAPLAGRTDVPEGSAPFGLAVLDVRKITSEMIAASAERPIEPPFEIAYAPPEGHQGFGVEWSPAGDAIYVLERSWSDGEEPERNTQLVRVPFPRGGTPTVVAKLGGVIDFFMPPVSRFEHGEGPSKRPYWIALGHPRGLFVVDPKGRNVRRLAKLPATGLHNIEWHPGRRDQLALYFKRAMMNSQGERFKGLYLVHLDRIGRGEQSDEIERLHEEADIHTLWYSPKGTYVSWATADAVYLRKSEPAKDGEPAPVAQTIVPTLEDHEHAEVKGFSWHHSEKKLAVAVGNAVLIYEPEHLEREPLVVARLGRDTDFVAEPVWVGNEIVLTQFCDIAPPPDGVNRFDVEAELPEEETPEGGAKGASRKADSGTTQPPKRAGAGSGGR